MEVWSWLIKNLSIKRETRFRMVQCKLNLEKDIILDKVSFSYGDKEKCFRRYFFKKNAKQTVAIVGESAQENYK